MRRKIITEGFNSETIKGWVKRHRGLDANSSKVGLGNIEDNDILYSRELRTREEADKCVSALMNSNDPLVSRVNFVTYQAKDGTCLVVGLAKDINEGYVFKKKQLVLREFTDMQNGVTSEMDGVKNSGDAIAKAKKELTKPNVNKASVMSTEIDGKPQTQPSTLQVSVNNPNARTEINNALRANGGNKNMQVQFTENKKRLAELKRTSVSFSKKELKEFFKEL